jgi:RNA polymerase sigma factor (sigma-70 family)
MSTKISKKREYDDSNLAQSIIRENPGANAVFYERFFNVAKHYAFEILKDSAEAEDIATEVIYDVIASIKDKRVKNLRNIGSYLISVACNKARNLHRKKGRQKRGGSKKVSLSDPSITIDGIDSVPNKTVFDEVVDSLDDIDDKVHILVDQIPDKDVRAIVRLRYEGFGYSDIPLILDWSKRKVKNIYYYKADQILSGISSRLNEDKFLTISEIISSRLQDHRLILNSLKKNYKYLNLNFPSLLILLNSLLLDKMPKKSTIEVTQLKAEILVFLLEVLINKGQLKGHSGAFNLSPTVLSYCVEAGDIERQIRTKLAEEVLWRILKNYDKALDSLNEVQALTTLLPNNIQRVRINYKIKGERGRILSLMGDTLSAGHLLNESLQFEKDAGDTERTIVKGIELADNFLRLGRFDHAFDHLQRVTLIIPEEFINGRVKYHKVLSDVYLSLKEYEAAGDSFRKAWLLSNKAGLLNQFGNLFGLLSRHNIDPHEFLSDSEIEHGVEVNNRFVWQK